MFSRENNRKSQKTSILVQVVWFLVAPTVLIVALAAAAVWGVGSMAEHTSSVARLSTQNEASGGFLTTLEHAGRVAAGARGTSEDRTRIAPLVQASVQAGERLVASLTGEDAAAGQTLRAKIGTLPTLFDESLLARSNLDDTRALLPSTLAAFAAAMSRLSGTLAATDSGKPIAAEVDKASEAVILAADQFAQGQIDQADAARGLLARLTETLEKASAELRTNRDARAFVRFAERERSKLVGIVNQYAASVERLGQVEGRLTTLLTEAQAIAGALAERSATQRRSATEASDQWVRILLIGSFAAIGGGIALTAALGILAARSLVRPLRALTATMTTLASGQTDLVVPHTARTDEVGDMARAVLVFRENAIEVAAMDEARRRQDEVLAARKAEAMHELARDFDQAIGGVIDAVTDASAELRATANDLSGGAEMTGRLVEEVAAASSKASASATEAAANTDGLAAAVTEIGARARASSEIASGAARKAAESGATVGRLAEAAERIGGIVGVIQTIAAQTNLLALNATIEAARAGEAGKGFAVVASEVKALAQQATRATDEISVQITEIQSATNASSADLRGIAQAVVELEASATAIASAVQRQQDLTGELRGHMHGLSAQSESVADAMVEVSVAGRQSRSAAASVLGAATRLNDDAAMLRQKLDGFLETMRAA